MEYEGTTRFGAYAEYDGKPGDATERARELYMRCQAPLRRYLWPMVRNEHDVEDLVQQTFVKVMVGLGDYEERGLPLEAWMYRIARNTALDFLRKRGRVAVVSEELVDRAIPVWEETRDLLDAFAQMPVLSRRVLLMRHLVGLNSTEISAEVSRSVSAVDTLHHRARKELVRRLEGAQLPVAA